MKFIANSLLVMITGMLPLAMCGCRSETSGDAQLPEIGKHVIENRLLKIAAEYKSYQLVGEQMNWAPTRCLRPTAMVGASFSKSESADTHGRKLYYLLAAKLTPYLNQHHENPIGQAIVKESWLPEEVDPKTPQEFVRHASGGQVMPFAARDGKLYKASQQGDLFVMFKTDPQTPGTDNGWVYGTLTPDGKIVTSAGRVQSCMECHQQAGKDRLFGPKI